MRAIWSGALSFGLIYIPVKLYDATRTHSIDFDLIRRKDHCRIHYARVCRETGEEVSNDEIVRGYQYKKGSYIIIEEEDIKRANVQKTQTIEIATFVDEHDIDHKSLEKPYYLEPAHGAEKVYALLRDALHQSHKAAIGRFVMRTREHLALITSEKNVVVLNRMRFPDEIRSSDELNLPELNIPLVKPMELEMAIALIEQLSSPWTPENFHDTYYEDLKTMIKNKIEGKKEEPVVAQKAPEAGITDLFEQLSRSIEEARSRKKAA